MFHFHIDKTMVIPLGENANTDGAVLVHHDSLLLGKQHHTTNMLPELQWVRCKMELEVLCPA